MREACWIHPSAKTRGYAAVKVDGVKGYAHRFAYEALVGPIPAGMHLDHLCRNRACYNPRHLEPVAQAENNRRAGLDTRARRTHCPKGHSDWAENNAGSRRCAECHRQRERVR